MSQKVTLSAKKQKAIHYLITHGTVTAAANASGVKRETLHRWMREPAFRQALAEAETEALNELRRRLLALRDKAVDTIESTMDNPGTPYSGGRIRAADVAIRRLLQIAEAVTLEDRMNKLERLLNESREH